MHSASTVLDDIIDELQLKYDSSVGLLDGDAVRKIPSLNTLQNLSKLLTKLSTSLTHIENKDNNLLLALDTKLNEGQGPAESMDEEEEIVEEETVLEESADAIEHIENIKRNRSEDNFEEDVEEEDSLPLSKRRKLLEEDDQGKDDDIVKKEIKHIKDSGVDQGIKIEDDIELFPAKAETEEPGISEDKNEERERLNSKDDPVPPVQTGSFTQGNDTRLINPNSKFVTPQILSKSAIKELGLFSEENNGFETQGKEYLKKKYGVASYPENDLKDMLPGEIPDCDYSKSKAPSNQVQFSTYQSYIESFFRPFVNEDIKFLGEKFVIPPGLEKNYDPLVTPYLIPKLGPLYTEIWTEEDAALGAKLSSPSYQRPPIEAYKPKGDTESLVDENLLTEDVSCGPLSSRLLSAILSVHEVKEEEEEGDNVDTGKKESSLLGDDLFNEDSASQLNAADAYRNTSDDTDFHSMEERLKRELRYIGIFANMPNGENPKTKKGSIIDSDDWIVDKEDDEICAEIRSLQKELKGAVVRNRKRKKALAPILQEHLAYQEFCTILEDLDKQVDQAYAKRLKAKSKRKKIGAEPSNTAQQQTANSGLKSLLEKRSRWISNIGKLFEVPEVMKRIPNTSVFGQQDQSDDDEADAEAEAANEQT